MPFNRLCKIKIQTVFAFMTLIGIVGLPFALRAQEIDVWIGTGGKDGIFHLKLDTANGKLSKPTCAAPVAGAGFLAMHPTEHILYSTARHDGENGIAAYSFGPRDKQQMTNLQTKLTEAQTKFGPNHRTVKQLEQELEAAKKRQQSSPSNLTMLNFAPTADGGAACVGVDKTGNVAFSAQYGGGSTSTYQLKSDGSIETRVETVEHGPGSGVMEKRQASSHPHWVGTSPDNRFLFVPDLGKDAVVVYQFDTKTGKPTKHAEVALPPGSGPRHMKFHTSGKYVYVLNELTLTVSVFEYDTESAGFSKIQLIETLPADLKDKHLNSAAEIRVHPTGKFVYTSNRGHDSITVFSVDQSTGKLTFVEHESIRGAWPRNFNIDPSGKWLLAAGQHSNTLAVFEIDSETGELTYARQCVNVPSPICVLFENQ